jgi:hypothetical protein
MQLDGRGSALPDQIKAKTLPHAMWILVVFSCLLIGRRRFGSDQQQFIGSPSGSAQQCAWKEGSAQTIGIDQLDYIKTGIPARSAKISAIYAVTRHGAHSVSH